MSTHQTAVSRICRTIANTTRLQLLWGIFDEEELCVRELALRAGISASNASNQLQELAAKEFIIPKRGKQKVFYKPCPLPDTTCARALLPALRICHDHSIAFQTILTQATAFTHERRIQIVRCLTVSEETFDSLLNKTGMTPPALNRHLRKLIRRRVIVKQDRIYQMQRPKSDLARCLLTLATQSTWSK